MRTRPILRRESTPDPLATLNRKLIASFLSADEFAILRALIRRGRPVPGYDCHRHLRLQRLGFLRCLHLLENLSDRGLIASDEQSFRPLEDGADALAITMSA